MIPKMLRLRSFGQGEKYTAIDSLKAAAITVVGSLAVVLGLIVAKARYGDSELLDSLAVTLWLVPFLFGMGFTELKGHSAAVKAVFIGVPSTIVIAIAVINA